MISVQFKLSVSGGDPATRPVTFVGKKANLEAASFSDISPYLGDKVTETTFNDAVATLSVNSNSSCSLYLTSASVGSIPSTATRNNTPAQSLHLQELVIAEKKGGATVAIIVVCSRSEVLASGCAISRAFPPYSLKSGSSHQTIEVGFILTAGDTPLTQLDIDCLNALTEGINLTQTMVDKPCNIMDTTAFIQEIINVRDSLPAGTITTTIIQGQDLIDQGFGGIHGVGKASDPGPALGILSYTPSGATETICMVGKGIVYDTGGLSLKSTSGMHGMKSDLGGAAAILAAFKAMVVLGFRENLHALCCIAENSVGPASTRPDDIHTLYSGKTVEINNTDAEGRIVCGDGVAYATKVLNATQVVDMATLTGSQGVATGFQHSAVLCNNDVSEQAALVAGKASGELVYPIIYCPELHLSEFRSIVADMKNSASSNSASPSCAGLFIEAHLSSDYTGPWTHIDTGFPAFDFGKERGTGVGVALLATLYGKYSNNPLLRAAAPQHLKPFTSIQRHGRNN